VAHHTVKQGYLDLVERINRFPQGAPPSEFLYRILEMLFSEREAELVSLLPIKAFNAERAAQVWKMPVDSVRRTVAMAVERGTLQHLIFDNQALASHRAMAAVLGAILRLPPVKRTMARGQLGSRYLDKLIEWDGNREHSA